MSVYTNSSEKNLLNLGRQTLALDVSTRNPYFATIVGFEAGILATGLYNALYGYRAGYKINKAQRNVFLGANAGLNANSDDNVLIGFNAGKEIVSGIQNIHIGNFACDHLNGNNNIMIGFKNTFNTGTLLVNSSNNVGVGFQSTILGYFNNCYGNNNDIISVAATVLGSRITDHSSNSLLIGQNIANTGNNAFIIHTKNQATLQGLENSNANYFNIQDFLVGNVDTTGKYVLSVQSSNLNLQSAKAQIFLSSNITFFVGEGQGLTIDETVSVTGKYSSLQLSQNVFIGSSNRYLSIEEAVNLVGTYGFLSIQSNLARLSSGPGNAVLDLTTHSTTITQSNKSSLFMDDIVSVQGKFSEMILGSNYVTIAHDDKSWVNMDESVRIGTIYSDVLLSSNVISISGPESKLEIGSNFCYMSNSDVSALIVDKSFQYKAPDYAGSIILTSNFAHINRGSAPGSLYIDDIVNLQGLHSGLLLSSNMNSLTQSSNSQFVMDTTLQLRGTYGGLVVGSNYVSCSNSSNSFLHMSESVLLNTRHGSQFLLSSNNLVLQLNSASFNSNSIVLTESNATHTADNLLVNARLRCNSNASFMSSLRMCRSNFDVSYWDIFLGRDGPPEAADLVFKSRNGTVVSWTDDFAPEILNFTGKHRCSLGAGATDTQNLIGCIVIAQGRYSNLEDKNVIDIDEAIPVVELAPKKYDARAFGVISGFETSSKHRTYRLGNMMFSRPKPMDVQDKVIVNSVGEGAIWVVDCNGGFDNGDLITTSHVLGYGMRQKSKVIKAYTVGKITCDCAFDVDSDIYRCEVFLHQGKIYKRALVGCVYKF